jgi:hypothetical protein
MTGKMFDKPVTIYPSFDGVPRYKFNNSIGPVHCLAPKFVVVFDDYPTTPLRFDGVRWVEDNSIPA